MVASRIRRAVLGAALATAGSAVPLLVVAPPAAGLEQPAVTISEGQALERKYPIVAGNNPANQAHRPETCRTSLYCDVIRLTIVPPTVDEGYFVRVQMSWKTQVETDTPGLGEMTNNDMDMYIYYVPYDDDLDDDENQATSGASGAQPETAYVSPAGDYDIVVVNFLGVNEDGYRLTFTYVTETSFTPFELLDDGRPPPDTSDLVLPPAAPPALPAMGPSPFIQPQVDLTPLSDFDDPFGLGRPVGSNISARVGDLLRQADNAAAVGPAKPVSAAAAMFWLVGFPLLLVGLAGAFFMRRRSTALSLGA